MKALKTFSLSLSFLFVSVLALAQVKTEKIAVSGECGMCKAKIEKAAKTAGASYAVWNTESKVLTVKYKNTATSTAKIERAVAGVGYDTQSVKAADEAYNGLHDCCKYERTSAVEKSQTCCDDAKCKEKACHTDGKCAKDMSCCKEAGCTTRDCCTKA